MNRDLVLGIDFGSSSTIAGALVGDRIELIQDAGDRVIPSVVYLPDKGAPEVGRRAVARQLTEPAKVVRSVKRLLGLPSDSELVRRYAGTAAFRVDLAHARPVLKMRAGDLAPEQVAAAVLGRVRDLAEARFGTKLKKVVLTMSAAAPPGYRDAITRAAKVAQLEIVDLIAEPVAGALALDLHRQPAQRRVLVCDFGGGTFDVSMIVQDGMRFTPVATAGDHFLGGDDLDHALAEAIAGVVVRNSGYDMHRDAVRWTELVFRCENAKRQLSVLPESPLAMREAYVQAGATKDLRLTLELAWAEAVWVPLMQRVLGVIEEGLRRAQWAAADVDLVGMIGGSALVPSFTRAVATMFPPTHIFLAHEPELAVAQGATLLTARHRGSQAALPTLVA